MANEYDREKTCYEHNWQQARKLNQQLNRVPITSMTLTGGLWFGAGLEAGVPDNYKAILLGFAGVCNLFLILAAYKIRDVFQSYLEKIREFHPDGFVIGRPEKPRLRSFGRYSMLNLYTTLMGIAAGISFIWAGMTEKWTIPVIVIVILCFAWAIDNHQR